MDEGDPIIAAADEAELYSGAVERLTGIANTIKSTVVPPSLVYLQQPVVRFLSTLSIPSVLPAETTSLESFIEFEAGHDPRRRARARRAGE